MSGIGALYFTEKDKIKELEQQIERLNQYIGFYNDLTERQNKEIERLNNIIKEVREYIELVETLAINDKRNIFSMSALKRILDKGE